MIARAAAFFFEIIGFLGESLRTSNSAVATLYAPTGGV
jgi:hypothetical protein